MILTLEQSERERDPFGELTKLAADWQPLFFLLEHSFVYERGHEKISFFFLKILFLVASDNSRLSERAQETRSAEEDTIRPDAP